MHYKLTKNFIIQILTLTFLLLGFVRITYGQQFFSYKDDVEGFQINYPENWIHSNSSGPVVFVPSKEYIPGESVTNQSVYLAMGPDPTVIDENVRLESYLEYAKMQLRIHNDTWEEPSKVTLVGFPAYKILFYGPKELEGLLYAMVMDGKPYAISYVGFDGRFDKYFTAAQEMISSFKFARLS